MNADDLSRLAPGAALPTLLAMCRAQAARRRPADVFAQYLRDGFVEPAPLDQRLVHRLDGYALDAASAFEAMLLSPVAPLGVCSTIAPTSQDRTLSALRGTEVVSDPTNVLALECARRLKADPGSTVRLCTVHQVLRAQALPPVKGFTRHFRLFALASAGRGRADDGFEIEAVVEHVSVFDRLFDAVAAIGCAVRGREARVMTHPGADTLGHRVASALSTALPHVKVVRAPFEAAYYDGLRVLFGAEAPEKGWIPLADTGRFDWAARLTANRKQRFVASGTGTQLLPLLFGGRKPAPDAGRAAI